ncbi:MULTISPECIES: hypothetical protein [Cytobacillus]|uniref:Uncharacterized protein n=1 Tax=Cytobacillus stercorigallinarum TaxID=2762240 RepID=A0ABR8QSZ4_9BACI|nr:hypothetical protein [Cytobacillus stercorigallinarum]MBD7938649.1 hypothetical protein [Cytobacillus stercorigallinarum]
MDAESPINLLDLLLKAHENGMSQGDVDVEKYVEQLAIDLKHLLSPHRSF